MCRSMIGGTSLLGLLAAACLVAPAATLAQGAQQNETDLAFIQRMTASLKRTATKAEQLEETLEQMEKQASREAMLERDQYGQQDRYGMPNRSSFGSKEETYRRAGRKLRSLQKKAGKELEKLLDVQRSLGSEEQLDRKAIESTVARVERDVAAVEHDLRLGRF